MRFRDTFSLIRGTGALCGNPTCNVWMNGELEDRPGESNRHQLLVRVDSLATLVPEMPTTYSRRVCVARQWTFCSPDCRRTWFGTRTEDDFHPIKGTTEPGGVHPEFFCDHGPNPHGYVYDGPLAARMFMRDPGGVMTIAGQNIFACAHALNDWWREGSIAAGQPKLAFVRELVEFRARLAA